MNDCTSCSCVGGIKIDGSTCVWFEEFGLCRASECKMIGCGVAECSAGDDTTTLALGDSSDAATLTISLLH